MRARIPTMIVSAVGIASSVVFGLAAPAQAAPTGCSASISANQHMVFAECTGGTGQFRAKGTCVWPATGAKFTIHSVWTAPGNLASASCPPSNPLAIAATYETRN
jgi:hypothetical protein